MNPRLLDIRDLNDPQRYVPLRVPVFRAHERRIGDKVIRVTNDDLKDIARRTNEVFQAGNPIRLTVGHVVPGQSVAEMDQPAKRVGWGGKCDVAPFQGVPHIWTTIYAERQHADCLADYPFRSVDYSPDEKLITGVALLLQNPWMNMGAVSYLSGKVTYSYGVATMTEEDPTEDEVKQYAKMACYMKKKYPKLASYMEEDSSTNTEVPKTPSEVGYQAEIVGLKGKLLDQSIGGELSKLVDVVTFDAARETKAMKAMPDAERKEHIAYMRSYYAPATGAASVAYAGFLPTYQATNGSKGNAPLTATEAKTVVAYQQTGLNHGEALAKVKAERK